MAAHAVCTPGDPFIMIHMHAYHALTRSAILHGRYDSALPDGFPTTVNEFVISEIPPRAADEEGNVEPAKIKVLARDLYTGDLPLDCSSPSQQLLLRILPLHLSWQVKLRLDLHNCLELESAVAIEEVEVPPTLEPPPAPPQQQRERLNLKLRIMHGPFYRFPWRWSPRPPPRQLRHQR